MGIEQAPHENQLRGTVVAYLRQISETIDHKTANASPRSRVEYLRLLRNPVHYLLSGIEGGSIEVTRGHDTNVVLGPYVKFGMMMDTVETIYAGGMTLKISSYNRLPVFEPNHFGLVVRPYIRVAGNFQGDKRHFVSDLVGAAYLAEQELVHPDKFSDRLAETSIEALKAEATWESFIHANRGTLSDVTARFKKLPVGMYNLTVQRYYGRVPRLLDFGAEDVRAAMQDVSLTDSQKQSLLDVINQPVRFVTARRKFYTIETAEQQRGKGITAQQLVEQNLRRHFPRQAFSVAHHESSALYQRRKYESAKIFIQAKFGMI
jgi:hypothetical protein